MHTNRPVIAVAVLTLILGMSPTASAVKRKRQSATTRPRRPPTSTVVQRPTTTKPEPPSTLAPAVGAGKEANLRLTTPTLPPMPSLSVRP